MLIKMGYPAVKEAMATFKSGSDFDITSRDFKIADAIWGPDVGSLKGKSVKHSSRAAAA